MFKKTITALGLTSALVLAGCGTPQDAPKSAQPPNDTAETQQSGNGAQESAQDDSSTTWTGTGDFGETYTIDLGDIQDNLDDLDGLTERTVELLDKAAEYDAKMDGLDPELTKIDYGWLQMQVDNTDGEAEVYFAMDVITLVMSDGGQETLFPDVSTLVGDMTDNYWDADLNESEYDTVVDISNEWIDRDTQTTYKPGAKGPREVAVMEPELIDMNDVTGVWVGDTELTQE